MEPLELNQAMMVTMMGLDLVEKVAPVMMGLDLVEKVASMRDPSESGSFDEFGSLINICKSPSFSISFFSFLFLLLVAKP